MLRSTQDSTLFQQRFYRHHGMKLSKNRQGDLNDRLALFPLGCLKPPILGFKVAELLSTSVSSMSNISAPAGLPPPGESPYARELGIQKRRFSPTVMSCNPLVHPCIMLSASKVHGSSPSVLSNGLPSAALQPV
eukprot:CAMPEP_0198211070 /NCGR_PEP_ID=MMETSP1445-20131203/22612_1 /TAXON_ID=36898 /ORGANISM="Pyramimonas sp., Strain CCMP2087" /LENGTH=133 /DNA_ID=CAMNT_0043885269 /DNA_START=58 /DNA_END=459 /DNA_ORIENTATION=-